MREEKKRPNAPAPRQPITNPKLKQAAEALRKENNPQNMNIVLNELVRGIFLAPAKINTGAALPKPDANGRIQLPKDTKISFTLLNGSDGKKFFAAFTDEAELRKGKAAPGTQVMVLRFDDYAQLLAQNPNADGFVLNPFSDNLRFNSKLVASVKAQTDAARAAGKNPAVQPAARINPGDKITLVEPTVYPDALLDPVCAVLEKEPTIAAAFLQMMIVNDTEKSYLMVLDGPKDDKVFAAVVEAARPFLTANEKKMNLNITISASPLGRQGMNGSDAFYVKGMGRIRDDDDDE